MNAVLTTFVWIALFFYIFVYNETPDPLTIICVGIVCLSVIGFRICYKYRRNSGIVGQVSN